MRLRPSQQKRPFARPDFQFDTRRGFYGAVPRSAVAHVRDLGMRRIVTRHHRTRYNTDRKAGALLSVH